MPELPEVETIVCGLRETLPGRVVARAELTALDLYRRGSRKVSWLVGRRVRSVERRGKAVLVRLDRGRREEAALLVHLGMTGRLLWVPDGARLERTGDGVIARARDEKRHLHARWRFVDGGELWYVDPRRFGFVFVGTSASVGKALAIGPDPFQHTARGLARSLVGRVAPIKALLLDQSIVSGLGNIYADETLFVARVHPLSPGGAVAPRAGRLLVAARRVLRRAIRSGGTTLRDYRKPDGSTGGFKPLLAVYGRTGEPCPRCAATVERVIVAGRGTHACPRCQERLTPSPRRRSAGRSRHGALRREGCTPSPSGRSRGRGTL